MFVPWYQMLLAGLAFALPALAFTRLRLTASAGGPAYGHPAYIRYARAQASAAHLKGILLKIGWSWVLLCAPLLTYLGGAFDLRRYTVILLGCTLFGLVLSAVSNHVIESFPGVNARALRASEKAHAAVQQGNFEIITLIVFEACLVPVLQYPAIWAVGLPPLGYALFVAGVVLVLGLFVFKLTRW